LNVKGCNIGDRFTGFHNCAKKSRYEREKDKGGIFFEMYEQG
jgi:hypothetical protein